MIPTMESIAGFITGFGVVSLIAFIYFKNGNKHRRFDERYKEIHTKARTISWSITLIVLVCMWLGALLIEGPKLAFFLAVFAYAVMLISYGVSVLVFSKRM
ncbi:MULTISPECIES: DUF3796 domain-containing protein [Sporosarcina]|uniref:DUF3796 domain-containing protein n=1 Tax=Sporosarcina saromensis TaxID=359365 RepID=A0ABU4GD38_9BACL|nr:DUF3796 domain-containing protein [Sporosarcina saromensis]MDW0114901.1 DUF3796 domain-containing protein [Sporosarcina saromensis]